MPEIKAKPPWCISLSVQKCCALPAFLAFLGKEASTEKGTIAPAPNNLNNTAARKYLLEPRVNKHSGARRKTFI